MDAVVTVAIDRGSGDSAHFQDLAAVRHVFDQPLRPVDAEPFLVDVDVDGVLGVEGVVEGDQHDARFVGAPDHRLESVRVLHVDHDRVEAGIDEIVDRGDLRGDVLAGRDDLELLEPGRDVRLRRVGLGGLDHLDAPGVGDIAVRQRDPERSLLGRVFEELGVARPRREAGRIGAGAGHDLRSRGVGGRPAARAAPAKAQSPRRRTSCMVFLPEFFCSSARITGRDRLTRFRKRQRRTRARRGGRTEGAFDGDRTYSPRSG